MAKNYELGKVGQIVTVNATTNVLTFSTTSAVITPSGNVAQRPATPANGMIRYNTDYNKLENYANGAWANVGSVELVDSITNTSILYAPTANAVNYLNSIKANLSGASFSGPLSTTDTFTANVILANNGAFPVSNGIALGNTTARWAVSATTLAATSTTTLSGALTLSGTTTNINATALTTGSINLGGATQTGAIVIGRSTANQVVDIANGATASGSTKTVEIATEGLAGSNTVIVVGPTASNSYLTINSNNVTFATNTAVMLPAGTTAQRPTGTAGMIRYNANLGLAEVYSSLGGGSWGPLLTAYSDVRQQFTASNNQTTFTVNYLAGAVDVYYNGIKLRNGTEVDVSSGSSVVLAAGAANGALVEVVGKGPSYVVSNTSQVVYQQFTASNNQTTFTVSGGYVPGMVDVYVEGIKLVNGTDVNVSSGNNIVLSTGIPNNSLVEVRGVFTPINPQSTTGVRQTFIANSTVNNNFTVTGGYIPGFVDVYYNGAKLVNGSDVDISSGTTVALATNAAANAIVDVVGINYYTNAGGVTTPVRQSFTASANQTTFSVTGGYTPGMIDVYQNGVKLVNGADVNVSGGSSVVLATGAANNDTIDVVGFSAVSYQDAVKKSGDTMTGTLNINDRLNVQTSNAIVLTLNSTHPSGGYSTFFTNSTPIADMGTEQQIFSTGNTLNFAIGARTGYNLSLGSGPNRAIIINSSGYINKPLQPAFSARATGGSQAGGTVQFNVADVNISSSFNTSTYRFTAPVAGNYFFCASIIGNTSTSCAVSLHKNGSRVSGIGWGGVTSSAESGATINAIINLAVGDYVTAVSTNQTYNNNYNNFSGFLVG